MTDESLNNFTHTPLPSFAMRLVNEGHQQPHRAEYAIIKSCVIHGWSEAEAWDLLLDFRRPGGPAARHAAPPLQGAWGTQGARPRPR
jgi:hypothetical protein